jgi:hypothetical protein
MTPSLTIGWIENRDRTPLWDAIAHRLQEAGHKIYWIVQNHAFIPKTGHVTRIPYPRARDLIPLENAPDLAWLAQSDRGALYFQSGTEHYGYYSHAIRAWLTKIAPDVVFGECTLFHELLTIHHASQLGIRYIEPSGTRYPPGKLMFHYYSDLRLDAGRVAVQRTTQITDTEIDQQIALIISRAIKPAYMARKAASIATPSRLPALARIALARWLGERYNTPSLVRKLHLQRQLTAALVAWDKHAAQRWPHRTTAQTQANLRVLLPLQIQPEANLDCWGRAEFRNQAKFVTALARQLAGRGELWLKFNPHAKYEMNDEMIAAINANPNVMTVPRNISMGEVWHDVQGIVTVTGTVAIEALLADKPLFLLSNYLSASAPSALINDSLARFPLFLGSLAMSNTGEQLTLEQKRTMLRSLIDCSFPGVVGDPRDHPDCLAAHNINLLAEAFLFTLHNLPATPAKPAQTLTEQ